MKSSLTFLHFFLVLSFAAGTFADEVDAFTPIVGTPAPIVLTPDQQAKLEAGKTVIMKKNAGDYGWAKAVFRVNTAPSNVWSVLTNYKDYVNFCKPDITKSEVYLNEKNKIGVDFNLHHWLAGTYVYYTMHELHPGENYITWKPDESKTPHDLSSIGFWRVMPVKDQADKADVHYLIKLKIGGIAGIGPVKKLLMQTGAEKATQWVKREAEALKSPKLEKQAELMVNTQTP